MKAGMLELSLAGLAVAGLALAMANVGGNALGLSFPSRGGYLQIGDLITIFAGMALIYIGAKNRSHMFAALGAVLILFDIYRFFSLGSPLAS